MMNEKQVEAALRLALETFERMGHKDSIFAGEFNGEITALREALAAVPEAHKQPRGEATLAQQDYWQEEARRYAQNADFWRGKYEATTAQQQEPVAEDGWLQSGGLLYRLTDERRPQNRDEINVTMADGSRSIESRTRRAGELLDRIRSSPPIEATPLTSQRSVKPWQGLTEGEIRAVIRAGNYDSMEDFARAIEAKLRELNEHKEKNA